MPSFTLKLEAIIFFLFSIYLFGLTGYQLWILIATWITPDLGMIGYFFNSKLGSLTYNLSHSYSFSFIFLIVGFSITNSLIIAIGAVWISHISLDRFLGYGLKYPDNFKHTHLQEI